MTDLTKQTCVPCEGGVKPFTPEQTENYISLVKDWQVEENTRIVKNFEFKDFTRALEFVNQVGTIAEEEGHHPNIFVFDYNKVKITLYTHAIAGLSQNDFIIAAKVDSLQ